MLKASINNPSCHFPPTHLPTYEARKLSHLVGGKVGRRKVAGRVTVNPEEIEARSFAIIDRLLAGSRLTGQKKAVVQRVVHATAEPRYAKDILFHPKAIKEALNAIKKGKFIVVDSQMVKAGINKKLASIFRNKIICLLNDKDIIRSSIRSRLSRSMLSMRKSRRYMDGGIVAIGNAPTALFEVADLVDKNKARPALIVGVPVGFVGAKESKEKLLTLNIPYITNKTRYGGSSVAVSIINALLKIASSYNT